MVAAGALLLVLTAAAPDSEAEIRRLVATYAQSVNAADTALAAKVWSTTPDVSFIHPGGHEHGWEAIKSHIYEGVMGGLFSERKLTVKDVAVHLQGDSAWVEFYWDFVAKWRKDGATETNQGRETQVYKKTGDRWALVHVHYSNMPAAAPAQP